MRRCKLDESDELARLGLFFMSCLMLAIGVVAAKAIPRPAR